jgi:2-polyprenyl-3-methyl-5-hydroxy-6-metoxy-1,4-benzoquinol methylase
MITQMMSGLRQLMRAPGRGTVFPARLKPAIDLQQLLAKWWYYSVELAPGRIAKGVYPDDLPMLPRIMLRRCLFAGLDCLDLGSMEGLIPTLMKRQGARRVTATDFNDHCAAKMAAVRTQYEADFEFQSVGLLYDLGRAMPRSGYDLINLSGLLYHVFSPLLILAAVRPLLKRDGLMIVSTNVVTGDGHFMEFNNHGRLQTEANTFWYPSVRLLDYMLRFMKLAPIDCESLPHQTIAAGSIAAGGEYVFDKPSGYLSVVCRATDDVMAGADDAWMRKAAAGSWEHLHLTDWRRAAQQPVSPIRYDRQNDRSNRHDQDCIDLFDAVHTNKPYTKITDRRDSHILFLDDHD